MIKTINVCWQIKTYYSSTENREIVIIMLGLNLEHNSIVIHRDLHSFILLHDNLNDLFYVSQVFLAHWSHNVRQIIYILKILNGNKTSLSENFYKAIEVIYFYLLFIYESNKSDRVFSFCLYSFYFGYAFCWINFFWLVQSTRVRGDVWM